MTTANRTARIIIADADRCEGSREDSNYFSWIVTDRDLNLFGQCIACGQDIPLENNRYGYYMLVDHEMTFAPAPTAATRKAQLG